MRIESLALVFAIPQVLSIALPFGTESSLVRRNHGHCPRTGKSGDWCDDISHCCMPGYGCNTCGEGNVGQTCVKRQKDHCRSDKDCYWSQKCIINGKESSFCAQLWVDKPITKTTKSKPFKTMASSFSLMPSSFSLAPSSFSFMPSSFSLAPSSFVTSVPRKKTTTASHSPKITAKPAAKPSSKVEKPSQKASPGTPKSQGKEPEKTENAKDEKTAQIQKSSADRHSNKDVDCLPSSSLEDKEAHDAQKGSPSKPKTSHHLSHDDKRPGIGADSNPGTDSRDARNTREASKQEQVHAAKEDKPQDHSP